MPAVRPLASPSLFLLPLALATLTSCTMAPGQAPVLSDGSRAVLALLETTDVHATVRSFDYFKLADDPSMGFERTATLIDQARAEFANTLLVDNGDTIQGTPLADFEANVQPVPCDQAVTIYRAMSAMRYDVGSIGNHEFNYGLAYLSQVTGQRFNVDVPQLPTRGCAGPSFPQVLSNVVSAKDDQPLFAPYVILNRDISATAPDGRAVTLPLRVGVMGFTPPTILQWDKRWLDGKVRTPDAKALAERYVGEMKAKGADVILAIAHSGLDHSPYTPTLENTAWHLATVPGIDALLLGHSHQVFPNAAATQAQFNLPQVDKVRGTVHGVPTVMANFWGKHLGVIQLALKAQGGHWVVDRAATRVEARPIQDPVSKVSVAPSAKIAALSKAQHEATVAYVKTPIGESDFRMSSYFADVGDPSALGLVNAAQRDHVVQYIQANRPDLAGLPVLSVASPFKSGFGGGNDYTDVAAGPLAIYSAADLYLYPNTLHAVKVTGAQVRGWLERAAARFNRIDPQATREQRLLSNFPAYNFDMFTSSDIRYEIDVTQPQGSRIVNLRYQGRVLAPQAEFIVATNNYRASGGGSFPGLDGSNIVYAAPDTNRDVLIAYIQKKGLIRAADVGQQRSWRFAPVKTAGPVVFTSARGQLPLAQKAGLNHVRVLRDDDGSGKGLSVYAVDLSADTLAAASAPTTAVAAALPVPSKAVALVSPPHTLAPELAEAQRLFLSANRWSARGQKAAALRDYGLAAEAEHPAALQELAHIYREGRWGLPADRALAGEYQRDVSHALSHQRY